MQSGPDVSSAKAQLLDDFNRVVSDTEALLRAMAAVPGDKARVLRESVEENLQAAKNRVRELQGLAVERTSAAARATDAYVHENPWPLIGGAVVLGFVIGLLVAERRSD